MRPLFLLAVISKLATAQLGGPVIGYVPEGGTIRPMYGLPAAGSIGAAIASNRDLARIAISPSQTFAVATTADNGAVMVFKPSSGLTAITGAGANPDIIAISPHGLSAALWLPLQNQLQAISGLPDSPVVRTIDASFLNASPLSIAISDDGQWVAGLWSTGVYAFGPSSQAVSLQTDPGVVALAFFHNSHSIALATSARATSIADLGGGMQNSVLYDYSSNPLSPRAIALSFDNSHAVIADSTGHLLNINVASASASTALCGCSPQGLYGLGGGLFRLNGTAAPGRSGARTELKLFDANAGSTWIVPPAFSEAGGRQ
jgi:hypothetical protein